MSLLTACGSDSSIGWNNNETAGAAWKTAVGGYGHTVALKSDGTLWARGYNYYGQLGIGVSGEAMNRLAPSQVP